MSVPSAYTFSCSWYMSSVVGGELLLPPPQPPSRELDWTEANLLSIVGGSPCRRKGAWLEGLPSAMSRLPWVDHFSSWCICHHWFLGCASLRDASQLLRLLRPWKQLTTRALCCPELCILSFLAIIAWAPWGICLLTVHAMKAGGLAWLALRCLSCVLD